MNLSSNFRNSLKLAKNLKKEISKKLKIYKKKQRQEQDGQRQEK